MSDEKEKAARLQLRLALTLAGLVERIEASRKALENLHNEYEPYYEMAEGVRDIEGALSVVVDKVWGEAFEAMAKPLDKARAHFSPDDGRMKREVLSHKIKPDELSIALAAQSVAGEAFGEHVGGVRDDLAAAIRSFINDWVAEKREVVETRRNLD